MERLLAIAVEISGAARGLLLLPRDGELAVAARAVATGDGVALTVEPGESRRPGRETVVAEDGSSLVLPLLDAGRLLGALSLEGAPGTFTPRRVAALERQAAIAVENARLRAERDAAHERVRAAERDGRVMVDTFPVMCWT